MQRRKGRYYLGRVIKEGLLTQEKLLDGIRHPGVFEKGKYKWTIVGCEEGDVDGSPYIFGNVAKYEDNGAVPVVREESRDEMEVTVHGLLVAKSPFIYFRGFSGIAYMHVWNAIEEWTFRKIFSRIITGKYDNFFVECTVEPISDLKSFTTRIMGLKTIMNMQARVHPPNPLFGSLWEELKDYMIERKATTLNIKEECSSDKGGLLTNIQMAIQKILSKEIALVTQPLPLMDAAMLMATDGYGRGQIIGEDEDSTQVIIRTADTQKSFLFAKEPEVAALATKVYAQLHEISKERNMKHASKK